MTIRVAYVCADAGVPVFGSKGASVHVQEVVRALQREGAAVEIFAVRCERPYPGVLEGVRCHALPSSGGVGAGTRELDALALNDRLAQMLDEHGPFDLVYERYSLWSTGAMRYARRRRSPAVLEVNAPLVEEQASHRSLVNRAAAERCAAEAFGAAGAVLAVSDAVARYVSRMAPAATVYVAPNGVDPDRFTADIEPSRPAAPGVLTLGFVGTMKPWHDLDLLVDGFERVHRAMPNSRLLMVGDGPACVRLASAARHTAAIEWTGAVSSREIPGLLTSMDVAAAPYPAGEDFYFSPLKILEYMAAGLPVVASRIGQIADLVSHQDTGLLCEPGDTAALASTVLELFADGAKRRRIGRAAARHVREAHTWRATARRILMLADGLRRIPGARAMAGT